MNALDIKNVNVKNGEFWLRNISFEVPKGSIVGLVGRNGAGKTTLINTIANCLERESGTILYDGLTYWDHEIEVKRKIGIVFDKLHMNNKFTPKRFKKLMAKNFTDFDNDFFDSYIEKFQLPTQKTIDKFSIGMQHKFMLIAVIHEIINAVISKQVWFQLLFYVLLTACIFPCIFIKKTKVWYLAMGSILVALSLFVLLMINSLPENMGKFSTRGDVFANFSAISNGNIILCIMGILVVIALPISYKVALKINSPKRYIA